MKSASSLRRRVSATLFAASGLALVTVAAAVFSFEYRAADLRARAVLESLAETMIPGIVASLDFDSAEVAAENLRRLEPGGMVLAATVFRTDPGDPARPPLTFAAYLRPGSASRFAAPRPDAGFLRHGDRALYTRVIHTEGQTIGFLQLEADISPFRRSLNESLTILGLVLAVLALSAIGMSRLLQHTLTNPLLRLAATVSRVHTHGDYSTRAEVISHDEVGRLAEDINLMLAHIEQRDRQLAEQTAFQQAVMENAGVSIISTDTTGIIRTFNATAEHMLGYRREEVVGRHTPAGIHDQEELARRAASLSQTLGRTIPADFALFAELARQVPSALEWTYVRKDGSRLPVFLVISALRTADGSPLGFCGIATDLTERKAAEAAVRTSEERMHRSFEASPIALALSDQSGTVLYLNRKFTEWFGYSAAEIPTVDRWYHLAYPAPEEREYNQRIWSERLAEASSRGGEMQPMEATVTCRDGRRRLIEFRCQQFEGLLLVAFTDITERKAAEEAIRASEERFRVVAEQTGQLIFDEDLATGRRIWAGAAAMIGSTIPELNTTQRGWWTERVHPDDREDFRTGYAQIRQQGGSNRFIYRFHHCDGRWLYLSGMVTALPDATGKPTRILGTIADVTQQQLATEEIRHLNAELEQRVRDRTAELDRRVAEVEHLNTDLRTSQDSLAQAASRLQESNANLLAANQELESFSYSVSHDLRAPLRNIAGFIELLRKRTASQLDGEADRYFGIIGTEAVRMAALIDDLLTFSRIGRAELHFAPVQLATLVAEVQSELQSDLTGRQIEWRLQPMPPVLGDRTLLRQVIANLVANAVKFTRQRHPAIIEIGVRPTSPGAELLTFFIRDNGAGFDPKYTHKLFGVFQRLHNPRDFEGTGIGLANVKRIVNRHGGHTWADGVPNEGATFYFSLKPAKRTEP